MWDCMLVEVCMYIINIICMYNTKCHAKLIPPAVNNSSVLLLVLVFCCCCSCCHHPALRTYI